MLFLLEGTSPVRFIDLIFGLTEGWWRFKDHDLRKSHPLLPAQKWKALLLESGFTEVSIPSAEEQQGGIFSKQALIIARADSTKEQAQPGLWLIFADSQGVGKKLENHLLSNGQQCILVYPGEKYKQITEQKYTLDSTRPEDFQRLLKEALPGQATLCGVVHLWSLSKAEALEPILQRGCGSVLFLIQSLIQAGLNQSGSLWLVTRGAQPVGLEPDVSGVAQSPLWGMAKGIVLEEAELGTVILDLDPKGSQEDEARALFEEIWDNNRENQVGFRNGYRYVARLLPFNEKVKTSERVSFYGDKTYLITGGLKGLGLLTASWMVEHGARHLALLGRSLPNLAAQETLRHLEEAGVQIRVFQADVSQREEVDRTLMEIEESMPPLKGIIHSAGLLDDGVLVQQRWERFERVMGPKVHGAWNLHTLTSQSELDFFVLFSSAASLLGSPGQANHGAANAFLDALAYYRKARGLPALSINWGAWSEVGAAARLDVDKRVKLKGLGTISPQQGLRILEKLLLHTPAPVQVGVVPVHWPVFMQQFPQGSEPLFIADLIRQKWKKAGNKTSEDPLALLQRLQEASDEERHTQLARYIQQQVADVLRLEVSSVDNHQPLNTMGLDSLMAVELRNRIRKALAVDIPVVSFMEGLSVEGLASQITPLVKTNLAVPFFTHDELESPKTRPEKTGIDPQKASQMLETLDQLTDEEVDELLTSILPEEDVK